MCDEWPPRLGAKQLAKLAAERLAELQAAGEVLHPIANKTRALAVHFWGKAWMRHLSYCESEGLCLAPGRTLLRHGCVLDVKIFPGRVEAKVSADRLYEVCLEIPPPGEERVAALCQICSGQIDSLVSLLEGKVDESVMQQLCDPESGLLPEPTDWRMFCTCADWSTPCPHAAAVIYAVGCMIDADPSLLFLLRAVEPSSLVKAPVLASQQFDAESLSATFGIHLDLR